MLNIYIINFHSITSPIRSYTLFGALCWAYRLSNSEEKLIKFLKEFSEKPKFLISTPFPITKGVFSNGEEKTPIDYYLFPKPVLPLQEKFTKLEGDICKKKERKNYKKAKLVTEDVLKDLLDGNITEEKQIIDDQEYKVFKRSIIYKSDKNMEFEPIKKSDLLTKNVINRITNTSNNLFTEEGFIFNRHYFLVKFYDEGFVSEFNKLLKIVEYLGLGKNKNIGWGKVKITELGSDKLSWLNRYIDYLADRFITLSPIIPKSSIDVTKSYYEYEIYKSYAENSFLPFLRKQKVLYLLEGSILYSKTKDFKGQLKNVVKDTIRGYEIYQYGYEFPLRVMS